MLALIALGLAARLDDDLSLSQDTLVALQAPQGSPHQTDWPQKIAQVQQDFLDCAGLPNAAVIQRYHRIPMLHIQTDQADLQRLSACPGLRSMGPNLPMQAQLAQSLPMVGAPIWHAAGWDGSGTAIAVLDSGINWHLDELGGCLGGDCKVVGEDIADGDADPADCGDHGTNVSAIVAGSEGMAPGARIVALKVFPDQNCPSTDYAIVAAAMDRALELQNTYHIVALNLSVGGNVLYSGPCDDLVTGYTAAIDTLTAAGILVVVASGNDASQANTNYPACLDHVMSVGAVYDDAMDPIYWQNCTDENIYPDKVACFSNGGPLVDMVAPGAMILAGGVEMGGTSQAAPHVAGAVALLAQAWPWEDGPALGRLLQQAGTPIIDDRGPAHWVYPRLELSALLPNAADLQITLDGPSTLEQGAESMFLATLRNRGGAAASLEMNWSAEGLSLTEPTTLTVQSLPDQPQSFGIHLRAKDCGAAQLHLATEELEVTKEIQVRCANTPESAEGGCAGGFWGLLGLGALSRRSIYRKRA